MIETTNGAAPAAALFGAGGGRASVRSVDDEPGSADHQSFTYESSRPLDEARLRAVLESLPASVVRAKGIVWLAGDPDRPYVVQLVGTRLTVVAGTDWGADGPSTRLVMIGLPGPDLVPVLQARFQELS